MGLKTPLYDNHVDANARIVDFGGWDMPLHYGSQKEEHHAVRRKAGVFDVSHMTIVDLKGERVRDFLRYLVANDVAKLKDYGKALYTCMLNPAGGVIDDLIIYFMGDTEYRLIVNAATREKDLAWIREQAAAFGVEVDERAELAMIAVQGPSARELAAPLIDSHWRDAALALRPFNGLQAGDTFCGSHRLHGRRRLGNRAPGRRCSGDVGEPAAGGRHTVRARCARHAAA